MRKRVISWLLIFILVLGSPPALALAEDSGERNLKESGETISLSEESEEEIFPEGSVIDLEEELGVSDEESFPDGSESELYTDEDLNASEEEIQEGEASEDRIISDEDLGGTLEEAPPQEGTDSAVGYAEEDTDLGLSEEEEADLGSSEEEIAEEDRISSGSWNDTAADGSSSGSGAASGDGDLGAPSGTLSASASTITVNKNGTGQVKFTCSNFTGSVYLQFGLSKSGIASASWGGWSGNSIPLNIKGTAAGSLKIYVWMKSGSYTLAARTIMVKVVSPSLSVNVSSDLNVKKGSAKKITYTVRNTVGSYYLQYGITNSNICSCAWGNSWKNGSMTATVTGKNAGSTFLTVYLKSAADGSTLARRSIRVVVSAPTKLSLSAASISVGAGGSTKVTATYSNYSGSVYMQYGTTNTSAYSCSWGSWSGSSIPLTVGGKAAGSGRIYIYLKDASTGATLATASFSVNVYQSAKVAASANSVSVPTGSTTIVRFTVSGISGRVYLQYGTTNSYAYSCSWGAWNGSTVPLTIQGKNVGSGRITVYLKNTSGTTLAKTTVSISVTESQKPKVTLSQKSLTLKAGNAAFVIATVSNINTSCYLQYGTTNNTAYACRWSGGSGNSYSLIVTGKAAGSGKIRVYLKRKSDNETLSSAEVSVKVEASGVLSNLSYSFGNFSGAASLRICQYMFNNRVANSVYNMKLGAGGNCFGMASTSGMLYAPNNSVYVNTFNTSKTAISELNRSDKNRNLNLSVEEFVQALQIAQVSDRTVRNFVSGSNLKNLTASVTANMIFGRPTLISIYGKYNNRQSGHAILAYGVEKYSSTQDRLLIYDNNYPLSTRYLYLNKNASSGNYTGWSYDLTNSDEWGSNETYGRIAYTAYSNYYSLWTNRGSLTDGSTNLVTVNSDNFEIMDVNNELVATVQDGTLSIKTGGSYTEEYYGAIEEIPYTSLDLDAGTVNENYVLRMPVDLYTIKNTDTGMAGEDFTVEIVNEELSARVVSQCDAVTVCADDSCNLASVLLEAEENEEYQIILGSSRENEPDEIEWSGVGTGDIVSVMVENGNPNTCNTETAVCVTREEIISSEDEGGQDNNSQGGSSEELSDPSDGNSPAGDGNSFSGGVQTAGGTSDQGQRNGMQRGNVITASDIVKTTSKKKQRFDLGATAENGAPLSYISDNKAVRVSATGQVTVKKNYVGRARITVIAAAANGYSREEKTVTIIVNPQKTSLRRLTAGRGRIRVQWKKKNNVTGYQMQISTTPSFKNSKKITIKGGKKTQKKIAGLKKNKRYFVRIRIYKKVSGVNYYSIWSKAKKIRTGR